MDRYLMVLLGGGTGALARYVLGTAIAARIGGRFPLGTLVINVSGSFLIGLLMTLLTERLQPHPNWRLLLVVGSHRGGGSFSYAFDAGFAPVIAIAYSHTDAGGAALPLTTTTGVPSGL